MTADLLAAFGAYFLLVVHLGLSGLGIWTLTNAIVGRARGWT